MGNTTKIPQTQINQQTIQKSLKEIFQNEFENKIILIDSLKIIHRCLQNDGIFRWSKQTPIYIVNEWVIKIFYNPHYQKGMIKLIDYFIKQEQRIINQNTLYHSNLQWQLLQLILSFLITFLNQNIKKFIDSLFQRQDISKQIKQLITKIKQQNYKIPNILPTYQNRISLFGSISNHLQCFIQYNNNMSNLWVNYIILLFMFYTQIYFQDQQNIQIVNNNITTNIKIIMYVLGISTNNQDQLLFNTCILFLQSILNKKQNLPHIPTFTLHKLQNLPIQNPQSIYYQIITIIVYRISLHRSDIKTLVRSIKILIKLVKYAKIRGDNKIFYYIQLICKNTTLQSLQRYTKQTKISTKIVQYFKKVSNTNYTIKTDKGQFSYLKQDVMAQIQESLIANGQQFQQYLFVYILSNIYQLDAKLQLLSQTQQWMQIIQQLQPIPVRQPIPQIQQ